MARQQRSYSGDESRQPYNLRAQGYCTPPTLTGLHGSTYGRRFLGHKVPHKDVKPITFLLGNCHGVNIVAVSPVVRMKVYTALSQQVIRLAGVSLLLPASAAVKGYLCYIPASAAVIRLKHDTGHPRRMCTYSTRHPLSKAALRKPS